MAVSPFQPCKNILIRGNKNTTNKGFVLTTALIVKLACINRCRVGRKLNLSDLKVVLVVIRCMCSDQHALNCVILALGSIR